MHYSSDMASINAKDTMRARNNLERIKWSPVLSQIDKASINELYNCKS